MMKRNFLFAAVALTLAATAVFGADERQTNPEAWALFDAHLKAEDFVGKTLELKLSYRPGVVTEKTVSKNIGAPYSRIIQAHRSMQDYLMPASRSQRACVQNMIRVTTDVSEMREIFTRACEA